ncbi:MAG: hypothetical protein AAGA64_18580 [Bacteroidota bacterium]
MKNSSLTKIVRTLNVQDIIVDTDIYLSSSYVCYREKHQYHFFYERNKKMYLYDSIEESLSENTDAPEEGVRYISGSLKNGLRIHGDIQSKEGVHFFGEGDNLKIQGTYILEYSDKLIDSAYQPYYEKFLSRTNYVDFIIQNGQFIKTAELVIFKDDLISKIKQEYNIVEGYAEDETKFHFITEMITND